MTVLENAVRPAIDSAHRPVGEPVGHHSTTNHMSGLQATHRTSGAPAIHTEIDSSYSAAPLPVLWRSAENKIPIALGRRR